MQEIETGGFFWENFIIIVINLFYIFNEDFPLMTKQKKFNLKKKETNVQKRQINKENYSYLFIFTENIYTI